MGKGKKSGPKLGTAALIAHPATNGQLAHPSTLHRAQPMAKEKRNASQRMQPDLTVTDRISPFIAMMQDPAHARTALPPVSLPARAIPVKLYQEVLLSTDANGSCGALISPRVAGMYTTVATWAGTSVATTGANVDHSQAVSFMANFTNYIPLCMEVVCKYSGNDNVSAGRFYGLVGSIATSDVATYPQEPTGCEEMTEEGISCTWFSTSPVWNNPCASNATSNPGEWMDTRVTVALIGGPPSSVNVVSVGIHFHLCAFPKNGVVGLTPMAALPDYNVSAVASLMQADESGKYRSAMSAKERERIRNKKTMGRIKDGVKIGSQLVGTMFPAWGSAATAAEALALLLL